MLAIVWQRLSFTHFPTGKSAPKRGLTGE